MDGVVASKFMNMDVTHPGVRDVFTEGGVSIRRIDKHFFRIPVDLAPEQTVSRDAASRHIGSAAFSNCMQARKRWTITRWIRGEAVG